MKYLKLLQKGGAWLGEMREYLLHTPRGGSLTWGSSDMVSITSTVKEMEVLAAKIAAKVEPDLFPLKHPTMDIDFYKWLESISTEDNQFLLKMLRENNLKAILMFTWQRSREEAYKSIKDGLTGV